MKRGVIVLIMVLLFLSACGGLGNDEAVNEPDTTPVPVAAPAPAPSPEPVLLPGPELEPKPEPTPEPTSAPVAVFVPPPVINPRVFTGEAPTPFEPEVLVHDCPNAPPICISCAVAYITMMERRFYELGDYLWGSHLDVPFMFACGVTRFAVANRPDPEGVLTRRPEGVYTGVLPEGTLISHTAADVLGKTWGMVRWDTFLHGVVPTENILRMMAHEVFHVHQRKLFEGPRPAFNWNPHMSELEARILVELEINALMSAVSQQSEGRLNAIHDALSFRTERRYRFGNAEDENALEVSEGTAEYIETLFMRQNIHEQVRWISNQRAATSGHLFGYTSGALYALLLDQFDADWQVGFRWDADMGKCCVLPQASKPLHPFPRYFWKDIITAAFRDFLDANLVGFGTYTVSAPFGHVYFTNGFVLSRLSGYDEIPADGIEFTPNGATGPGWEIVLNPWYHIRVGDGYYVVERIEQ